jgi:transcription elongation factor Elf1
MNTCFLLSLAAQRRALQQNVTELGSNNQSVHADGSAAALFEDVEEGSGTFVVPMGALLASQNSADVRYDSEDAASDGLRTLSAAAALPPPPAAARLDAAAAADAGHADATTSCSGQAPVNSFSGLSISQECRICLSSSNTDDLIHPCCCCGTLSYVHSSCLSTWVEQRGSLVCELCGQRYKEQYAAALGPVVVAAMQRKKYARVTSSGRTLQVQYVRHMSRDEWICLLMSLILLGVSFVVISVTLSKRQEATAAEATAAAASAAAHAATHWRQ